LKEGIKCLNDNKKDSQLLRSECATLEHQSTECLNDILKEILESVKERQAFYSDFYKFEELSIRKTHELFLLFKAHFD
jgi:hypothetical protein